MNVRGQHFLLKASSEKLKGVYSRKGRHRDLNRKGLPLKAGLPERLYLLLHFLFWKQESLKTYLTFFGEFEFRKKFASQTLFLTVHAKPMY